jgi:hypothetical protein
MKMEGSISSSALQPPGEDPWKIAAKPNNITHKQPALVAYSITLALPGTVAFCVPKISDDLGYLQRLQALLQAQTWVINQQVNLKAGSVVITYKTGIMSDFEMRSELAQLLQTAEGASGVEGAGEAGGAGGAEEEYSTQHSCTGVLQYAPTQHSAVDYSIVHAIPGRIRFHVPQIASDRQYVQRLENLLKADPVVTSERINREAASVAITYKTATLENSKERSHSVVEDTITHLTSLIQSANAETSRN